MEQLAGTDESPAALVAGSRSAQLAPTTLDRLLDRAQQAAPHLLGLHLELRLPHGIGHLTTFDRQGRLACENLQQMVDASDP